MADTILALSGTSNGRLAVEGFRQLERRTGRPLVHLAEGNEERRITYADTQARPVPVITSPEWSGSETGGRRYAPFTVNVEELKPWHTLTGRMHFYLDHDWIEELGEQLPVYRPPLDMARLFDEPRIGSVTEGLGLCVRYLTPHSKWSIHSEYQDNLFMLSPSRGGPTMWMSPADATKIGVANDWVEAVNRNGVMMLRAIVSHRMPEGTVFVHHAQERTIDVPLSQTTGNRGGIHKYRFVAVWQMLTGCGASLLPAVRCVDTAGGTDRPSGLVTTSGPGGCWSPWTDHRADARHRRSGGTAGAAVSGAWLAGQQRAADRTGSARRSGTARLDRS